MQVLILILFSFFNLYASKEGCHPLQVIGSDYAKLPAYRKVPGWEGKKREIDLDDRSQRVLTIMNDAGADMIRELAGYSDMNIVQFTSRGQKEVDPWVKDHLPLAVAVGTGKDKYYILLHYNDRNSKRGYFPEAQPSSRPENLPSNAKPFSAGNGHTFWAVPKGTEKKVEGGNFQKTKDFTFMTKLIQSQNHGSTEKEIVSEFAGLTQVPESHVVLLESVPGERTGHLDLFVRVLDYEKNEVVVPTIPSYAIKTVSEKEGKRLELGGKYNEFFNQTAQKLSERGLTVKRIPIFPPKISYSKSGSSLSPFGVDVNFDSTVNYSEGPGGILNVPVSRDELLKLSEPDQKLFHSQMVQSLGERYNPVVADSAFAKDGGPHCLTWTINAETGRVSPVR